MPAILGSNVGRWWTKRIPAAAVSSRSANPGCAASAAARLGPRSSRIARRIAAKKGTAIIACLTAGRGRCGTDQSIASGHRRGDTLVFRMVLGEQPPDEDPKDEIGGSRLDQVRHSHWLRHVRVGEQKRSVHHYGEQESERQSTFGPLPFQHPNYRQRQRDPA